MSKSGSESDVFIEEDMDGEDIEFVPDDTTGSIVDNIQRTLLKCLRDLEDINSTILDKEKLAGGERIIRNVEDIIYEVSLMLIDSELGETGIIKSTLNNVIETATKKRIEIEIYKKTEGLISIIQELTKLNNSKRIKGTPKNAYRRNRQATMDEIYDKLEIYLNNPYTSEVIDKLEEKINELIKKKLQ